MADRASGAASTFSRLVGRLRIGADFFAREGVMLPETPAPRGVVDHLDHLRHPALDPTRVHPSIAVFLDDTCALDLHVRSRWHFPFSLLWRVGRPILRWVGQFVYPAHEGRILTRALALDPGRDGRRDVRGIVRTYADTGDVMQVVAYATREAGGSRFMSAAFPIPGGQLTGHLRLDPIGEDEEGRLAVVLTSERREDDDAGVWFVRGSFAVRFPAGEALELWAPGMRGAPSEPPPEGIPPATILGRHEQRFCGLPVVTHHYWFWPRASCASSENVKLTLAT